MNGEGKNFAYMWTLYILTKILVKMGKMGFIVYGNNSVVNIERVKTFSLTLWLFKCILGLRN